MRAAISLAMRGIFILRSDFRSSRETMAYWHQDSQSPSPIRFGVPPACGASTSFFMAN